MWRVFFSFPRLAMNEHIKLQKWIKTCSGSVKYILNTQRARALNLYQSQTVSLRLCQRDEKTFESLGHTLATTIIIDNNYLFCHCLRLSLSPSYYSQIYQERNLTKVEERVTNIDSFWGTHQAHNWTLFLDKIYCGCQQPKSLTSVRLSDVDATGTSMEGRLCSMGFKTKSLLRGKTMRAN